MIILSKKNNKGIIQILPVLIVAILAFAGLSMATSNKNSKNVLSESSEARPGVEIKTPEPGETVEPKETAEPEETPDNEVETETESEVKDGTHETKIKIRSGKNQFEFQQEGAKVSIGSNFPLSVNSITRELTVTTPSGSRVVAILPQQAVDNMLAQGTISTAFGIHLKTENDGSLIYNVDGSKEERLFSLFPVSVPKTVVVSAQTGQVLVVNQSVFSRILDFLSI